MRDKHLQSCMCGMCLPAHACGVGVHDQLHPSPTYSPLLHITAYAHTGTHARTTRTCTAPSHPTLLNSLRAAVKSGSCFSASPKCRLAMSWSASQAHAHKHTGTCNTHAQPGSKAEVWAAGAGRGRGYMLLREPLHFRAAHAAGRMAVDTSGVGVGGGVSDAEGKGRLGRKLAGGQVPGELVQEGGGP